MWGIIPAAGEGNRIQPLAFSKELLPAGSRFDENVERPRAISEYLVERMILAGADKICFVIAPGKSDILEYYGAGFGPAVFNYVVQPEPVGLCDAIFRALPLIKPSEPVLVGLPDTIWFPEDALKALSDEGLSFLLFPVQKPELFDAVVTDESNRVLKIQVKQAAPASNWIWGAFKLSGADLLELYQLWCQRDRSDQYFGTLITAFIGLGKTVQGIRAGRAYVDVGTLHGYHQAIELLRESTSTSSWSGALSRRPRWSRHDTGSASVERAAKSVCSEPWTTEQIQQKVAQLGQWFHNFNLRGVMTAPNHFLGDYPSVKWKQFAHAIPQDLSGATVLDIGCNAGFYSIEMKRRGADRVVGIDSDETYLAQAKFAAEVCGLEIELHRMSVYEVARLEEKFDIVLFMGVLYHLRHPLLALDLIHDHASRELLIFQSMQRGTDEIEPLKNDYDFWQEDIFNKPGFPRLHFIENRYSGDQTNWWIPNRACSAAMLRSAGFQILDTPEKEVFICRWKDRPRGEEQITDLGGTPHD